MTLELFRKLIKDDCNKTMLDLRSGKMERDLNSKNNYDSLNSFIDYMYMGSIKRNRKPFMGASQRLGYAFERSAMNYAESIIKSKNINGEVYRDKIFNDDGNKIPIDILFRIDKIVYNMESKANIELDTRKTVSLSERIKIKENCIYKDERFKKYQILSNVVVWTKSTSKRADKTSKKGISGKNIVIGGIDFFTLFGVIVNEVDYVQMISKIAKQELLPYLEHHPSKLVINYNVDEVSDYNNNQKEIGKFKPINTIIV